MQENLFSMEIGLFRMGDDLSQKAFFALTKEPFLLARASN